MRMSAPGRARPPHQEGKGCGGRRTQAHVGHGWHKAPPGSGLVSVSRFPEEALRSNTELS